MKKTFLIVATFLSCVSIFAQVVTDNPLQKVFKPQMFALSNLSAQVGLSNTLYVGFYKRPTTAIDVRFGYDLSKRCVFGLRGSLLGSMDYTYLDAIQRSYTPEPGDLTPPAYPMEYRTMVSMMNFYLFNHIYLAKNSNKRWGIYMATHIGAAMLNSTIEPAVPYDTNRFKPRPQGIQTGAQTIPTLGVGLGGHWKVGAFLLTPEILMFVPLNEVKNPYVYNPLPFHFQINTGVAVPFGKRQSSNMLY